MRWVLVLMVLLVPLSLLGQDAKVPTDAKKVVEKYDAAVEAAKKAYDATVAKARDQALKDLKPIQSAETKKGNLDGAIWVKDKIDELTAQIPKEPGKDDLATPAPPTKDPRVALVIGKWKVTSPVNSWESLWEFKDDGTMGRHEFQGKYVIEKNKVVVTWANQQGHDTVNLPKGGVRTSVLEGANPGGVPLRFERIEEK